MVDVESHDTAVARTAVPRGVVWLGLALLTWILAIGLAVGYARLIQVLAG